MVIIETPIFTKLVQRLMTDDDYRQLQSRLCSSPHAGDVIRGSGGLRKIRWGLEGKGKRGGVRVIYYSVDRQGKILMLYLYKKNEQADLTPEQVKILRKAVLEELL